MSERFEVQVEGLEDFAASDRGLVFHGINKSGSLTLTRVLADGYYTENRANQFFSTYLSVPRQVERLRKVIANSTGHSFYSAHDLYGSVPARPRRRRYVTQFRNPLPRMRSCHQWLTNQHGLEVPFEKWVVNTRGLAHSQVVQFGLGFAPDRPKWQDMSGEEVLARAIENIERDVVWFGIAEYFEETAFTMAALCGLKTIDVWARDTRNENRALVQEWPAHEVELVREVCTWDMQLYRWAVDRFQAALSELRLGPELERYRTACAGQYNDRLDVDGRPVTAPLVAVESTWDKAAPSGQAKAPTTAPGRRIWGRRAR